MCSWITLRDTPPSCFHNGSLYFQQCTTYQRCRMNMKSCCAQYCIACIHCYATPSLLYPLSSLSLFLCPISRPPSVRCDKHISLHLGEEFQRHSRSWSFQEHPWEAWPCWYLLCLSGMYKCMHIECMCVYVCTIFYTHLFRLSSASFTASFWLVVGVSSPVAMDLGGG